MYLIGCFSIFLAVSLPFYKFAENSTKHKIASIEYREIAHQLAILKTSVVKMKPNEWRNSLEAYSKNIEAIGRRVDIPSSLKITKKVIVDSENYTLGQNETKSITTSKIPEEGYVTELESVYHDALLAEESKESNADSA